MFIHCGISSPWRPRASVSSLADTRNLRLVDRDTGELAAALVAEADAEADAATWR